MKLVSALAGCVAATALAIAPAEAFTTNQIDRFGITFYFNAEEDAGAFVNGDWWVVGPVTITNMTPEWNGTNHGWMVNPSVTNALQGFDARISDYDDSARPSLPLTITNGSLVKVESLPQQDDGSYITNAVVLTVLAETPPGNGAQVFRPPYMGDSKPLFTTSDLQTNLLPNTFAPVTNMPSLGVVSSNFNKCLRLDYREPSSRLMRARGAMYAYQPNNTPEINEAMLRLMMNDDLADKWDALVLFTQHAMDKAYAVYYGFRRPGTGHDPNHRVVAAWGATMLGISDLVEYMATADGFHEDWTLVTGVGSRTLWGLDDSSELNYWTYVISGDGNRSHSDPYGYVDGGDPTQAGYQLIVSQSLKGQALIFRLFPALQECAPADQLAELLEYAERWTEIGRWYSPDPVAPFDGDADNYGVTYGPDGSGGYIAGEGRFLEHHGADADAGQYRSDYVAAMWDAYWPRSLRTAPDDPPLRLWLGVPQ